MACGFQRCYGATSSSIGQRLVQRAWARCRGAAPAATRRSLPPPTGAASRPAPSHPCGITGKRTPPNRHLHGPAGGRQPDDFSPEHWHPARLRHTGVRPLAGGGCRSALPCGPHVLAPQTRWQAGWPCGVPTGAPHRSERHHPTYGWRCPWFAATAIAPWVPDGPRPAHRPRSP